MALSPAQTRSAGLAAWMALVFVAAALGALASLDAGVFYAQLVRPGWAPPASVFGPVWTLLYAMMGIAAWRVWCRRAQVATRQALGLFLVQLLLNALWSWLFFAWHRGALAFVDIVVLLVLIVATVVAFWRIDRAAGALLGPYLLWVSFASLLNYSVWQLNPPLLG